MTKIIWSANLILLEFVPAALAPSWSRPPVFFLENKCLDSDQRNFGPTNLRTNESSEQRTLGTMNLRSKKPSEQRHGTLVGGIGLATMRLHVLRLSVNACDRLTVNWLFFRKVFNWGLFFWICTSSIMPFSPHVHSYIRKIWAILGAFQFYLLTPPSLPEVLEVFLFQMYLYQECYLLVA